MRRVACVLVRRGAQVLAVTRESPPLRFGLPGGGVEHHETFAQGAARELFEETGLRASGLDLIYGDWGDGRPPAYVKVFEAKSVSGTLRPSPEGYPAWVPLRALTEAPYAAFPRYTRRMVAALRARGILPG